MLGACAVCERELIRPVGGLEAIADLVRPVLVGTPWQLAGAAPGGQPVRADAGAFEALVARAAIERMTREVVR